MKKNFLRILPIAAAVLLATSCSKDNDDNTIVENNAAQGNVGNTVVDNNAAQENVEAVHDFALTVSNSQSLSKLSLVGEVGGKGIKALKYDIGDQLYIALKSDGAPVFFSSEPLTVADISPDGEEATFHFTQTEFEGKTLKDVEVGFMGADGNVNPDKPVYTFSREGNTDRHSPSATWTYRHGLLNPPATTASSTWILTQRRRLILHTMNTIPIQKRIYQRPSH